MSICNVIYQAKNPPLALLLEERLDLWPEERFFAARTARAFATAATRRLLARAAIERV